MTSTSLVVFGSRLFTRLGITRHAHIATTIKPLCNLPPCLALELTYNGYGSESASLWLVGIPRGILRMEDLLMDRLGRFVDISPQIWYSLLQCRHQVLTLRGVLMTNLNVQPNDYAPGTKSLI